MIQITKDEMKHLSKLGYKFGETLHSDHSGHGHYWLTEDWKPTKDLNRYRAKHIIISYPN